MPLLSIKAWSCLDLHIFCCLSNTLPPTQRPTMASRPFLLMNRILTKGITCQLSSRPTTAILLLYVIGFNSLIWGIWTMLRLLKTMGTSEVKLSANRIVKTKVKSKISWLECEMFPNLLQYLVPIWWWLLEGCGTCRKWILIRRSGPLGAGLKVLHPEDELYRQNVWLSMHERSEDMVQGESRADNYHEKRKELEFLLQNIIEHQLQIQEARKWENKNNKMQERNRKTQRYCGAGELAQWVEHLFSKRTHPVLIPSTRKAAHNHP